MADENEIEEIVKVKLAFALMLAGIPARRDETLDEYVKRGLRVFRTKEASEELLD